MRTRAALFRAPGQPLEIAEIELDPPGPDDVLVRMAATGICGSDLHVVRGEWPRPTPMVLGHEGAGVVEAAGESVRSIGPGDRVVLSWAPSCGVCGPCTSDRPYACAPLRAAIAAGTLPDGTTRMRAGGETVYRMTAIGALAESVVVPAAAALPLPDDVPLEQAALIGCAALTGVGAVLNCGRVREGQRVLVVGAGGVGQFVVQGARIAGAAEIVAVDPIAERREHVRRLGANGAVHPDDTGTEFDVVFDAVGGRESLALALRAARAGGTVVVIGMAPTGVTVEVDPFQLTNEEKTLTGSLYGSEHPAIALPALLEHVRAGRIELATVIGPSFPLERADEAVRASLAGVPGRVLVTLDA
jgi:S-(hydroxymethyl)glutathione dehydrogenase / alcohol dehydrogenase